MDRGMFTNEHIIDVLPQVYGIRKVRLHRSYLGATFLSMAVMCGATEYIKARAVEECLVNRGDLDHYSNDDPRPRPLKFSWSRRSTWKQALKKADSPYAWPLLLDAISIDKLPQPRTVSVLLRKGADPNYAL